MSNQTFKNLQKAAQDVSNSHSQKEKMESLSKAFELFSQETLRLETAYKTLKKEFEEVNQKLEEANKQLKTKVSELDLITYYLNSILTNISQGILFIDQNGTVTTYNRTAEKILNVKGTKVLFSNFWDSFEDKVFGFSMQEVLSTKKSPETTFTSYQNPKGDVLELEINTTFVLKDEDESLVSTQGLIVLMRDITEIRRLQMTAMRNDRLKELGEMAAQVAHEIRNPLGGIKGFASLLKRDLKDSPELQKMADYIVEGTDNLNRLVTQVLNFARPVHIHPERVDLCSLLEEMKRHVLADASLEKHTIVLCIDAKDGKLMVSVDPQLIKGALLNLIINAQQAMPNGGPITLSAKLQNSDAVLTVSDQGIGIPQEIIEKIFSPFFTTKVEGSGFGLAEVYKVVQAHGGSIEVESKVGKGTTFTIKLPQSKRGDDGN